MAGSSSASSHSSPSGDRTGSSDPSSDAKEQAEVIELVRSGYDRLHRFIEKGLEYFQWLAKGRITTAETADLALVLKRAADKTPGLRASAVRFEVHRQETPFPIQGRAADLEQALQYLLENALKHSPNQRHVVVDLRLEGDRALLSVSDRGVGLRAEALREVFQPLTSADVAHHSSGSGLSLALAKVILEAHGGTIRAESEGLGQGSTFTIELPAVQVAAGSKA